jgi:hypothetical protein
VPNVPTTYHVATPVQNAESLRDFTARVTLQKGTHFALAERSLPDTNSLKGILLELTEKAQEERVIATLSWHGVTSTALVQILLDLMEVRDSLPGNVSISYSQPLTALDSSRTRSTMT